MRQINGIADAEKIQTANEKGRYRVTVTDGIGLTILDIDGCTYPAGLTPDRARYIAKQLVESAKRIEAPSLTQVADQ